MPHPRLTPAPRLILPRIAGLARGSVGAGLLAAALATTGLGLDAPPARAQSGAIDPTFGTGGLVTTQIGGLDDFGQAIAIQDDDKIVVAGYSVSGGTVDDFAVTRYDLDGVLDTSFGGTGKVVAPIGASIDRAFAIAIQGDDKIVVAGSTRIGGLDDFAVARFLPTGQLDTSFDGDGIVVTSMSATNDQALAVVIDGNGKILVGGRADTGANQDLALVRYNDNGSLDGTFGGGTGKVTLPVGTGPNAGDDEVASLVALADGKILVGGTSAFGSLHDMLVARLTSAGAFDVGFGGGAGFVRLHFGSGNDHGKAIALTPDDDILIAGDARIGGVTHFGVGKVTDTGVIDGTFGGGDGLVTTTIGSRSEGRAIDVFPEGRFVVAGFATISGNDDFALARYNVDGSPDTNFSGDGIVTTAVGSSVDQGSGVAIQSDRKIVVAGSMRVVNDDNFALARYLLNDCGNGTLDAGEQCDGGAIIEGDCCSSTCTVVAAATECRPAVDVCDITESCDGVSGACPTDAKLPDDDGDEVCNLIDICPIDFDPDQEDGDGDGPGDECDPCTNGVAVAKPKVKITKYTTGAGDDTFSFSGTLDFPAAVPLAPAAQGVRVIVEDALGDVLFDVDVPAGTYDPVTRTGWIANGAGTSHTFRSATAIEGVVTKAKLSSTAAKPDVVKFSVSGSRGGYAVPPVALPLSAIFVIDAPTAADGACGEASFPGPKPVPSCALNATGSTLNCK